ncbi:zona pellucida sperm-binding protein 4-like isoform X2 [Gopherus flavomarginatus]|uniref:zona pellucida sperm-binding protein 4-like isoform X2 n=2 Tax=Gopherus flavomarginatus TaxID=286002 RepID=UPI0021CBB486|nr:zona pellucida sperm-binding protein 4-like isoform X2 [Gopherus flavomarginatus]
MADVGQNGCSLGAVLMCVLYCPLALGTWDSILEDSSVLVCGQKSLQFILPLSKDGRVSHELTVWDTFGRSHTLQNDSTCGVWVSQTPDGSRKVDAAYDGCYIYEWNGNYLMVIGVEGTDADGHRHFHEKVLRCHTAQPALDVPSPSVCAAIQSQDRLSCMPLPITQADCEEQGCCYDLTDGLKPCYYGNTVTAQCTPDGQFSIVISRDVTLPPLILDSVHLVSGSSAGCVPVVKNNAFVLFQFPLSACGTTFQMEGAMGVYENELVADQDVRTWSPGSITRDSTFRLHVRCTYSASGNFLPLSIQVFTLPPPPAVSQPGPLTLELRIATEQGYGSYYADRDYPVVKVLRDPIYVEIQILQRTDPNLVLVLHQCWTTPSTNPQQQPQWPILVDGCPYTGDNYQTQLVPVGAATGLQFPSHYQRFIIRTFTFVDSASQQTFTGPVYLHCSASVCQPSLLASCTTTCPAAARGRRSTEQHLQDGLSHITSRGPVILLQDRPKKEAAMDRLGLPLNTKSSWMLAWASGTLLLGALFMSLLAAAWWRWRNAACKTSISQ